MKSRVVSASEFKAKCLACISEMERSGEPITITKRGRPVAVLGPAKPAGYKSLRDSWAGRIQIVGDIVSPAEHWEAVENPEAVIDPPPGA
jgi:prevent-host-death family protein